MERENVLGGVAVAHNEIAKIYELTASGAWDNINVILTRVN